MAALRRGRRPDLEQFHPDVACLRIGQPRAAIGSHRAPFLVTPRFSSFCSLERRSDSCYKLSWANPLLFYTLMPAS